MCIDKLISRFFIFSALFILTTALSAQSSFVSGTVKGETFSDPLYGVNIFIQQDSTVGTFTDFDGKFKLILSPGKYVLVFSFTGMQRLTQEIEILDNKNPMLKIQLKDKAVEFGEFIITSSKFVRKPEEVITSIETIKPALLESKNTTEIETALNQVPGVVILDEEPQIRGGSGFTFGVGSKVGVIIDSKTIITGEAGKPDWNLIPVENLKHVEVVKGPGSVLTGANAMSGAIFFNTQFADIKPTTKIQVFAGGFSSPKNSDQKWWENNRAIYGVSFLHSRKFGKEKSNDIVVSGLVNYNDSYLGAPLNTVSTPDTTRISDDEMKNKKFRLNVNYKHRSRKIKGLSYGLNGNIMRNDYSVVMAWYDDGDNFYRGYPGTVFLRKQKAFYLDPFVDFHVNKSTKHHLSARVLYNDVVVSNNENQSTQATTVMGVYEFSKKVEKIKNLDYVLGASGMKTFSNSLLYQASGSPKNTILNVSIYGEATKKIGTKLTVVAGIRGEHYSINDSTNYTKPLFRGGLNYKAGQATYLRTSFGQGYRFPSIAEKFISSSFGSFGVFSNTDLKPESGWNAEIGFKQGFKIGRFTGFLDGAGFIQEYKNTVEYLFGFWSPTFEPAPAGFKFVNTGRSRVTGIDASVAGKLEFSTKSVINMMVGYTYVLPISLEPDVVFAEDYNPGGTGSFSYNSTSVNPDKQILKYRFQHTLKFELEWVRKNISIGAGGRYFSKVENVDKAIFDFEESTKTIGGDFPPLMYQDYYYNNNKGRLIVDCRVALEIGQHQKVSLIANNILNSTYSLRPLKAEAMRSLLIQYILKF